MGDLLDIRAYVPQISLLEILPFLIPILGAIICLFTDAASGKEQSRKLLPFITLASLLATMALFVVIPLPTTPFVEKTFMGDRFGQLGSVLITFAMIVTTVLSPSLVRKRNLPSGEYYTLILFATAGATLLTAANEMLTAFISLEVMSLALYVLTGIDRRSRKSAEAAFKYFILGAFASAFLVLGIAFLYGATRTTYLSEISSVLTNGGALLKEAVITNGRVVADAVIDPINPIWIYLGFSLVFVGLCFKLTLAPFHMWAPDVYEGANTPTTLAIATASKVAGFAFFIHLGDALADWGLFGGPAASLVAIVAVASVLWGNIAALVQNNIKRMLAYSSVAHSGYMTVGVLVLISLPVTLAGPELASARAAVHDAVILYMAGYTIMNIIAFAIAYQVGGEGHMGAYRGLFYRKPLWAVGMALTMFSLVGIGFTPPTIGFMGKFYVFKEAISHGYTALAAVAIAASVISAFYYLSLVVTMFMREPEAGVAPALLAGTSESEATQQVAFGPALVVGACLLVFVLGVFPGLFIGLTDLTTFLKP